MLKVGWLGLWPLSSPPPFFFFGYEFFVVVFGRIGKKITSHQTQFPFLKNGREAEETKLANR